jgi:hypothetical protein
VKKHTYGLCIGIYNAGGGPGIFINVEYERIKLAAEFIADATFATAESSLTFASYTHTLTASTIVTTTRK